MTVQEAIEKLIFNQLGCPNVSCEDCQYYGSNFECESLMDEAAEVLKAWLASLPEGKLPNVTIEDLL